MKRFLMLTVLLSIFLGAMLENVCAMNYKTREIITIQAKDNVIAYKKWDGKYVAPNNHGYLELSDKEYKWALDTLEDGRQKLRTLDNQELFIEITALKSGLFSDTINTKYFYVATSDAKKNKNDTDVDKIFLTLEANEGKEIKMDITRCPDNNYVFRFSRYFSMAAYATSPMLESEKIRLRFKVEKKAD